MIKSPVNLQDLRRRIYVKVKAEPSWRLGVKASAGSGGVGDGCDLLSVKAAPAG